MYKFNNVLKIVKLVTIIIWGFYNSIDAYWFEEGIF